MEIVNLSNVDKVKKGIYKIYHKDEPSRVYFGSSVALSRRYRRHRLELTKGEHSNGYLQNVVNKYGIYGMIFEIVCGFCGERKDLRLLEREYIKEAILQKGRDNVMNLTTHTESAFDDPELAKVWAAKASERSTAMWKDPDYRLKMAVIRDDMNSRLDIKQAKSERLKTLWKTPEFVANNLKRIQVMWDNPEFVAKKIEFIKGINADEILTAKRLTNLRAATATDEHKAKMKSIMTDYLAVEENGIRHSNMLRERNANPEFQKYATYRNREVNARKVMCNETKEIFDAISDAARWLVTVGKTKTVNSGGSKIGMVCSGQRRIAFGYTWSYIDNSPKT